MMNAIHALGWALVHFLWQGAALALLLVVALAAVRPAAARTRYALSLVTLVAMVLVPVATGLRLWQHPTDAMPTSVAQPEPVATSAPSAAQVSPSPATRPASGQTTAAIAAQQQSRLRDLVEPFMPWLVVVWVMCVVALSIRLGYGWLMARRLRSDGTRDAPEALQQVLARLARRLRVSQPVRLLESLVMEVPAVIGWLRPAILVPTSALTGLTPQQIEVLLAHELAHVRRYDYIVNLLQSVIETLLFYHPAVWWVSRRVREEREHCCDDLVVRVCGDPHLYASALVGMERLRSTTPRLALAATGAGGGGSLLRRVQRLLLPTAVRTEFFPRWSGGIAGVMAVTVALLAGGSDRIPAANAAVQFASDTTRMAPDTVLRAPDPSQPLAQRWDWAHAQARQLGKRGTSYWIGYTVARAPWLEQSVYVDRHSEVRGQNISMSGRLIGNFQGFMFRGVRLAPLTGENDSDDIALLFGFALDQSGKPVLAHVHLASVYLPVDFRGRALVWLGKATDAQSLAQVQGLFAATSRAELREDLVSAIGIHGSSETVVPMLVRLLNGRESNDVREQAAEWLGYHPAPAAVAALSAAARNDPTTDVRRQAAEALGENALPAAFDSTIAIAKTATDEDARRAAVEALGRQSSDRALTVLTAIAQTDPDVDVEREAVETLGEMPGSRGLAAVRDISRNHPKSDVRREAIETLADKLPAAEAVALLKATASSDVDSDVQREAIEKLGDVAPNAATVQFLGTLISSSRNEDVQRQAVETLGNLRDDRAYNVLVDVARTHPSTDVRRKAIETLAENGQRDSVIAVLSDFTRDKDADVASGAIQALGEMKDGRARAVIARIARSPGDVDARRKALETYVENAPQDSALALLKAILASNPPEDVSGKVLEALEEMDNGAGIPLLIETARSHPNRDIRTDALRRLAESDDPRVQQLFEQTLRRP